MISYELPAPIHLAAQVAQNGGGGGGGVSLAEQYAAEMQAKSQAMLANQQISFRDREAADAQRSQQDQFEASRTYSPRDMGLAQAQMAEQQQRAQLQASLNQEELSQGEAIQLQRLKQGEDEVKRQAAAGTLSPAETEQALMQLRTHINPLDQKAKATQIKHMEIQNQAEQWKFKQAKAMELESDKLNSQGFPNRWAEWADPSIKQSVAEEMMRTAPGFAQLNPQQQEAAIQNEVRKRGGMIMGFQKKPGEWEIHTPKAVGGGKGGAGATDQPMHPSGVPTETYAKHYQQAQAMAMKEAATQIDDGQGGKKFKYPQTDEWLQDRINVHLNRMLPPPPANNPGAAAGASVIGNFQVQSQAVQAAEGLTPDEKTAFGFMLKRGEEITTKYPDPATRPKEAQAELAKFAAEYNKIKPRLQPKPKPSLPPEQIPGPPGAEEYRPAREVYEPGTGRKITIPAGYSPKPVQAGG